jgi:tetratricopeptide (TPR) repeat protein
MTGGAREAKMKVAMRIPRIFCSVCIGSLLAALSLASCATTSRQHDIAIEYYDIGNAWFELKKYDKAELYYNRALAFDRTMNASVYNLAVLYVETGKPAKALPILQKLLESDPKNVRVLSALAYANARAGENEEALRIYGDILPLVPFDAVSFFNYAVLLRGAGRLEEARAWFSKVVEAGGDDPEALFNLGSVEASLELHEKAVSHLESYLIKKPDDQFALRLLASLYARTAYYQKSLDTLDRLLRTAPGDAQALFERAYILLTAVADEKEGLAALDKAFAAGFSDEKRFDDLLAEKDLVNPDAVKGKIDKQKQDVEAKRKAALDQKPPEASGANPPGTPDKSKDAPK